MDLTDFQAVRTVVEAGTFSAAAADLRISQPVLSRRIARIEKELGARLFDRLPRHAAPTALGRTIAEAAGRLESEHDRALQEAAAVARGASGHVRVGSLAGGIGILARGIARFGDDHPGVWVEVRALGVTDAVEALRARDVDLATLPGSAVQDDLRSRKLSRWRPVVAIPPEHRFASKPSVSITELAQEPVLTLSAEFMVASYVQEMADRQGVRLTPRLVDGTPEAVLTFARRGLGVGVVPDSLRLPEGLVAVELAGHRTSRVFDYVIAWPADRTLPTSAQALVDILVAETAAFRR